MERDAPNSVERATKTSISTRLLRHIVKQKELEILLQKVTPHQRPSPEIEQYSTPASIAAEALFFAYGQGDISGKKVVDPGCGTGILAIGAKLLGAEDVVALDVDQAAVEEAMKNADSLGVDICFLTMDFESFPEKCDTVIMNPPFGAQKGDIHADTRFLELALGIGNVVYSFHRAETHQFIRQRAESLGASVTHALDFKFPIPRTFEFHRVDVKEVETVFLRLAR